MFPLIAPSIIAANMMRLEDEVKAVEQAGADALHVDIMDGHFVPNITIGPDVVEQLQVVTKLPLDVHLMVTPAEPFIEMYAKYATSLIIHPESTVHIHRCLLRIKELGCKAGVALNPGTPLECLWPVAEFLDSVLVMSVNPGFCGQHFIEASLEKIQRLVAQKNHKGYSFTIAVDGGINKENASAVFKVGANTLVAGNSIFKSTNYRESIRALKGV